MTTLNNLLKLMNNLSDGDSRSYFELINWFFAVFMFCYCIANSRRNFKGSFIRLFLFLFFTFLFSPCHIIELGFHFTQQSHDFLEPPNCSLLWTFHEIWVVIVVLLYFQQISGKVFKHFFVCISAPTCSLHSLYNTTH